MLEEVYEWDESISEDDYYEAITFLIGDLYPDADEEELEDILEEMLDEMPLEYAESFGRTVGNLGKTIGRGTLRFAADNPELTKMALTAAGGAVGGPAGAKIGNASGGILSGYARNRKKSPAAGSALSMIQNPQVQSSLARAASGLGNGTAPLVVDGKVTLVPVATFLYALIAAAQKALMELDQTGIIPPAEFTEALPHGNDPERQAEWLSEQLLNS